MTLEERWRRVMEGKAEAERGAGREVGSVRLLAVSKFHPASSIAELFRLGQVDFGENYMQEARAKQAELADLYYSGKGVVQDYAQAFFWAEKAASDGVGSADSLLGLLYYTGNGVTLDFEKAGEVFCRLAETGEPLYQVYAGVCSLVKKVEGERQEDKNRNEQAAVSWFEKAAKQRNSIGELMLGWCYAHGVGVEKDAERGKVLMSRAVIRGDTLPRNYEVILEGVLDTEK